MSSQAESPIAGLCMARDIACYIWGDHAGLAYAQCPSAVFNYWEPLHSSWKVSYLKAIKN